MAPQAAPCELRPRDQGRGSGSLCRDHGVTGSVVHMIGMAPGMAHPDHRHGKDQDLMHMDGKCELARSVTSLCLPCVQYVHTCFCAHDIYQNVLRCTVAVLSSP